eukprot:523373-Hanusia_phi.AAC.3
MAANFLLLEMRPSTLGGESVGKQRVKQEEIGADEQEGPRGGGGQARGGKGAWGAKEEVVEVSLSQAHHSLRKSLPMRNAPPAHFQLIVDFLLTHLLQWSR